MEILLLRYSQNNYQTWLYKLNLICDELFNQNINILAVNQAIFINIIIEKKTLVLAVASNEEMHFLKFI